MPEELATEYLNMRLPQGLMENLEKLAESDKRPVSAMARILIEEALAARAKKAKKQ